MITPVPLAPGLLFVSICMRRSGGADVQKESESSSVIETLPGPFDLLADEDSLDSELLQCLCGSRHILAAKACAVRRRKAGSHLL